MSHDIVQMSQKLIGHPIWMVPSENNIRPIERACPKQAGRIK